MVSPPAKTSNDSRPPTYRWIAMPRATKGSNQWENGKTQTEEKGLDGQNKQILTNTNSNVQTITSGTYSGVWK